MSAIVPVVVVLSSDWGGGGGGGQGIGANCSKSKFLGARTATMHATLSSQQHPGKHALQGQDK